MLSRFNHRPSNSEAGFTLLELLIVVIVIGILAAVALPVFLSQQAVAHDAAVKSDVRNTVAQVEGLRAQQGANAFGLEVATGVDGKSTDKTGTYISDGGKIVSSDGDTIQVSVDAAGNYTVAGYRTAGDGNKYKDGAHAFVYHSTTGRFTDDAAPGSEAPTGDGSGGSGSTGGADEAVPSGYSGSYKNLALDGTSNSLSTFAGSTTLYLNSGAYSAGTGDAPLTGGSAFVNGLVPYKDSNSSYTEAVHQVTSSDVKFYKADGSDTGLAATNCYVTATYISAQYEYASFYASNPTKNFVTGTVYCSGVTGSSKAVADALNGGRVGFTYNGAAASLPITAPLAYSSDNSDAPPPPAPVANLNVPATGYSFYTTKDDFGTTIVYDMLGDGTGASSTVQYAGKSAGITSSPIDFFNGFATSSSGKYRSYYPYASYYDVADTAKLYVNGQDVTAEYGLAGAFFSLNYSGPYNEDYYIQAKVSLDFHSGSPTAAQRQNLDGAQLVTGDGNTITLRNGKQ